MRSFQVIRPLVSVFVLAGLSALPLHSAVQNRIAAAVNDESRSTIEHTIPARAKLAADLGEAPANRTLDSVTLHFSMTAAQQADLDQLLVDLQNPSSPRYHQWLTPAQFGARFGLSSADLAKVTSWLTGKGLTVTSVAPSSTYVTVSGTVTQVEKAFGVSIHAMSENGEQRISNVNDPQLPSAIANVVTGVGGLNNFKPQSRASIAHPRYTSSITGSHYVAPGDFYTIYDVNQLLSSSINGQGISIAVVGQTDISTSDVAAFRSASGLSANAPTIVKATGYVAGTVSGDIDEAQLDVEWSGAAAPNATILFVTVGANQNASVVDALSYAISNNSAPIISISYGACENSAAGGWTQSQLNSINLELQQANAEGITVVGPAGDSGATDCDLNPPADFGLAVDFPASSPFVTAAGGTMFNEGTATGTTTYWNSNSNPSTANAGSAVSYIPETVWNESNSTGLGAGGGGASAVFSKPAWQVGTGVPADSARDVPDVSFNSASSHDGYLFCSQGSCTNGFRNSSNNLDVVGGTSVVAPTLAGVFALLEQQLGGGTANRLGNANPKIYGLANSTYYNNVFHDITTGNNDSQCRQGALNCLNGGLIGYNATQGYDLATGWGSLDVYNFVTKWNLVSPTGSGVTTGSAISNTTISSSNGTCGIYAATLPSGKLSLSITVASSGNNSTVPTGSVQLVVVGLSGASTPLGSIPLVNGVATYNLDPSVLASGATTVNATYSGDSIYAGSRGAIYLDIVSSTQKDFSFTPCAATPSTNSGSSAPAITFTLTPFNGFTGTINLTVVASTSIGATFAPATFNISSNSPVTTSLTLTAFRTNTQTSGISKSRNDKTPWYVGGSGAFLACTFLVAMPRRRRWGALLAVLLSAASIYASGCGSSSSTTTNNNNPTQTNAAHGTYLINVIATGTSSSGVVTHSGIVTFTVN